MDIHLLEVLSKGTVLGLAAGLSPGPLTFLVISETLRHGLRAGVKVALAPVLTDLPIIALAVLLLDRLLAYPTVYGIMALAGKHLTTYRHITVPEKKQKLHTPMLQYPKAITIYFV